MNDISFVNNGNLFVNFIIPKKLFIKDKIQLAIVN